MVFFQDYYHSYLPRAYETCRFGEYEVTIDSENALGDIVVRELRMASIKVHHVIMSLCVLCNYKVCESNVIWIKGESF